MDFSYYLHSSIGNTSTPKRGDKILISRLVTHGYTNPFLVSSPVFELNSTSYLPLRVCVIP